MNILKIKITKYNKEEDSFNYLRCFENIDLKDYTNEEITSIIQEIIVDSNIIRNKQLVEQNLSISLSKEVGHDFKQIKFTRFSTLIIEDIVREFFIFLNIDLDEDVINSIRV